MEILLLGGDTRIMCRGDIVLVEHEQYGRIVKSIRKMLEDGRVLLRRFSILSTPTEGLGPVECNRIIVRVTWRVLPSGA